MNIVSTFKHDYNLAILKAGIKTIYYELQTDRRGNKKQLISFIDRY